MMRKTATVSDASLGQSFVLPMVRPMSFFNTPDIPKASTMELLRSQRPVLGNFTDTLVSGVEMAKPGQSAALISANDIFRGLVGAGVGALGGYATAHVIGTIFSRTPETKARMAQYGAIGGAILNTVPLVVEKIKQTGIL